MRRILMATLVAAGIGVIGTSGATAAPVNGVAIDRAATANQLTEPVVYYHRHYYHHHYGHYGYRHHYYRHGYYGYHRYHRRHCVHRRYWSGGVRCWY